MYKKTILTILIINLFTLSAKAADDFPITLEPEIDPKTYSINVFYSDNFTFDNSRGAGEFRGEIKTHFLDKGKGIMAELSYQHLSGYNPAIISGLIPWGDTAHMHDASGLIGYRFPVFKNFGVYPYIKGRAIVTRGKGGDNFYGAEFGGGFEWQIYPESTHLNVRYGAFIPFLHNYTGEPDTVSPTSFILSNFETRLSYRFLDNWDAHVAFHMRTFPKYLGASNLATQDMLMWNGIMIGVGYVF